MKTEGRGFVSGTTVPHFDTAHPNLHHNQRRTLALNSEMGMPQIDRKHGSLRDQRRDTTNTHGNGSSWAVSTFWITNQETRRFHGKKQADGRRAVGFHVQ
ncbi:unnamed protein product [Ectocarpus sp. 12 AP-2014]